MNPSESQHDQFLNQIATYLANGLSDEERAGFEVHAADCDACAQELAAARADDRDLRSLFADQILAADFEDKLIANLRTAPASRWFALPKIHPFVRRAAMAVAASLLVATAGYVGNQFLVGSPNVRSASNLRGILQGQLNYSNEFKGWDFGGGADRELDWTNWCGKSGVQRDLASSYQNPNASTYGVAAGFKLNDSIRDEFAAAADQPQTPPSDTPGRAAVPPPNDTREGKRGTNNNHDEDDRKFSADSHRTFEQNPFTGVQRDNFHTNQNVPQEGQTDAAPLSETTNRKFKNNLRDLTAATQPNDQQRVVMRTYDVRDLNIKVPDFTDAPDFSLDQKGKESPPTRPEMLDAISSVVRDSVASDSWKDNGGSIGSIRQLAGQLIVTQTEENQEAVARLVETLRDTAKADIRGDVKDPEATAQPAVESEGRAIIRTGTMEFEVENFDATFEQIRKIVADARGYIGTINSERMPNGKVRGTVTLRVPPERTEDVIAKLRPLGEIKRQNLAAEEVTKQIADLSRQLETATTMQQRLGDLINASTTQPVKDRVSAEREAGEWRSKAQQAQGQIAALKNQVALATITVVLNEKGLEAAAILRELESVDMSVETEDVERSRADASKAIDEVKGRIVESQLKQLDAGQLTAKVVAEVSSDRATEVIDRLKQLGKVARLDALRQTTTSDNRPVTPGAKIERKDTRIVVAFYNLANVPPRVTSTANIACEDVEATHRTIGERVIKAGGRVISSNVNRQQANRASATMQFEVKSDQADAVLNDLRAAGELMKLESIQNNDTNSVTDAKRGFAVQLVSIASATPRQVTTKSVAASDVPTAYNVLLDEAGKVNARIVVSKLQQDSNQPANAWLDFEVRKTDAAAIDAAIAGAGDSIGGDVTVSTDVANTLASKVQYKIALSSADQLPPREVTTLAVETRDVEESVAAIVKAASEAGGRAIDSNVSKESSGRTMARLTIDVPLNRSGEMLERVKSRGVVRVSQSTKNAKAAGGQLARARIDVTFGTPEAIVSADAGVWATIRNGLSTGAAGLMWSLRLLVIGVCLIAPWAVAVWGGWKIARRVRASKAVA